MARLYAIVGTIERARFMLEGEVPYLQLRFKDRPLAPHRDEIRHWPGRYPKTRVILNDDLDEAIALHTWGVHLGQEDVERYPPERLKELEHGGPVLGISTHDDAEILRAKALGALMLGFGPLFPTGTKSLKRQPHGIAPLARAVRSAGLPLIAIGGIGEETLDAVADTGVAMIAMIAYLDGITSRAQLDSLQRRIAR
jgi:thiamine-phosphate pyrophosphorylase